MAATAQIVCFMCLPQRLVLDPMPESTRLTSLGCELAVSRRLTNSQGERPGKCSACLKEV